MYISYQQQTRFPFLLILASQRHFIFVLCVFFLNISHTLLKEAHTTFIPFCEEWQGLWLWEFWVKNKPRKNLGPDLTQILGLHWHVAQKVEIWHKNWPQTNDILEANTKPLWRNFLLSWEITTRGKKKSLLKANTYKTDNKWESSNKK